MIKPPPKTPPKPAAPKVAPEKPTPPAALPAPRVVQARTAQFKTGPKIAAPPVYRPTAKKIVQPKLITTARTIQRAAEDPYKQQYPSQAPKKPSGRASARVSPYGSGKPPRSDRLKAKSAAAVGVRPNYVPPSDRLGNQIWDGSRNGLSWSATIAAAMAATKAGGCQVRGGVCTGAADGIDHIVDFAELQSAITQYVICDGTHHWEACYKVDAVDVYNYDDDPSNMRWSCTQCNSQKGGVKGVYENQPVWLGECPGEDCKYEFRKQEAE